ncbi:MAG: cell division protein FtsQ/DivIB [Terriglobales bacterium]
MDNVRPIRSTPSAPETLRHEPVPALAAEASEETDYRRRKRPVPVRRQHRDWPDYLRRCWKPALAAGVALVLGVGAWQLLFQSSWFVVRGSGQVSILGAQAADLGSIRNVFASDLGRNIFFVPLAARRRAVERIPWVQQAAVMRLWPARLEVKVRQRTPVAFARVGSHLELIDASGVLLPPPPRGRFSFVVLSGLAGVRSAHPDRAPLRALRQAQVAQWQALQTAVDQGGQHASLDFSEVDLSDPDNLRARVSVPGGSVLVDLGDRNFGPRFQLFLSQIAAWRQKYPNLLSVDLHFDGQAIVDPGPPATGATVPSSHKGGARR